MASKVYDGEVFQIWRMSDGKYELHRRERLVWNKEECRTVLVGRYATQAEARFAMHEDIHRMAREHNEAAS